MVIYNGVRYTFPKFEAVIAMPKQVVNCFVKVDSNYSSYVEVVGISYAR